MKKYIALLLCFLTIFSLCSCNVYENIFPMLTSSDVLAPSEPTTDAQATTEPQDQTPTTP